MSDVILHNFINGQWTPAESGRSFAKLNPETASTLVQVSDSEALDFIKALPGIKKAQTTWAGTSVEQRAEILNKMAQILTENQDEWAQLESQEQALPLEFVRGHSLVEASRQFLFWSKEIVQSKSSVESSSVGLVSVIVPWTLGLRMACARVAPALAAGNAVIVKISEYSPSSGWILGEVARRAGLPEGVLSIFQGRGSEIGSIIAAHPSIRAVSFAGRLATGEKILQSTLPQLKKVQMAFGANNAALVLADAPIETCISEVLRSCTVGMGQLCWNTSRILVQESIYPQFVEALKEKIESVQVTPLISQERVNAFEERRSLAQSENAKFVTTSTKHKGPGFWAEPTFTLDLPMCSVLQQEEIGGPLISVSSVKYPHDMVKWANTGSYGHSAQVWSADTDKAMKWARKIEAGTIWINGWLNQPDSTYLQKQSGFGYQGGPLAARQFFWDEKQILTKF